MEDGEEWVTLRTPIYGHQADMLRSVLEGSDVEVFIPDEHMGGYAPHLLWGANGVRVQVRASQLERATDVLKEFDSE